MADALILHEYAPSGNCYKIRLTAAHRGLTLARRHYDIMAGATRTPAFLTQVSANGRIPVLQVGSRFLPESNAASWFLAEGSSLIPADPFVRADVLRWLFWEQYNHEPNIATLRFWRAFVGLEALNDLQRALLPGKEEAGRAALALMDEALARTPWLAGDAFTLADICLYAYTHVAEEGGFALGDYPNVSRWLAAVAAQPGHIPLEA